VYDRPQRSDKKSRIDRSGEGGGKRNANARLIACAALAAGSLAAGSSVLAQHETAYDVSDGARAYQASCANCHGPDGDLIAGIDFSRGVFRRPLTDDEIAQIISNGIPNTPMPPTPNMSREQALEIVAYLRSMPAARSVSALEGDPIRGQVLFEGKGGCMDCHRVAGRGSRLGPDLSQIGALRRAAELERSLLEPQAEVLPQNRFYSVTPKGGEPITGRLLNHDTYSVQIMDPDERLRSFVKADLVEHGFAESPMPSFADELTAQEIADLVSYLSSLNGGATQ
jgi:putative heme-binding domain-containing protein